MSKAFDEAFKFTLGNEGGYTNHPADRGGPTNWGITQSDLSRWRGGSASPAQVKAMKKSEAQDIYFAWYWSPLQLNSIKQDAPAIAMFDIGVVMGTSASARLAQRACNALGSDLEEDAHVGPLTLRAINASEPEDFVKEFESLVRRRFYGIVAKNPTQIVFLKGWLNRSKRLLTLI